MKKKFAIIAGEPNSVNSEIIAKSWKKININIKKKIFIIGNYYLIKKQFSTLKIRIPINKINKVEDLVNTHALQILNVPIKFKNPFKVEKKINSKYLKNCLILGHNLSINKKILGFINCPIDKKKHLNLQIQVLLNFLQKKVN